MRVAVVWNHPSRLVHCSFRFEQYLVGLRELGHEATVVCTTESAKGFAGPVLGVGNAGELNVEGFWRAAAFDALIGVTWHRMSAMLGAARAAGTSVISIADTDGRVGLTAFPWATLQRMIVYAETPVERVRTLRYFVRRWLTDIRTGSSEDREFLASTESSDAVILGNQRAKASFAQFLARSGRPDLDERVQVAPFTIAKEYLTQAVVPSAKRDRIAAIGRWDDPQKDAALLAAALERYLKAGAPTEVLIFGVSSEPLRRLVQRFPAVHYRGLQPPDRLAPTLSSCRAIVFSSRWEGSPHAAFEALALGATVVGTPMPCTLSWCEDLPFGSVATNRRPESLSRALEREMLHWSSGRRDARKIAGYWRSRLAPTHVCRQMLDAVAAGATNRWPKEPSDPI